jgi:hypothetical protein
MSEAINRDGTHLFTEEDIKKRINDVRESFYAYISDMYGYLSNRESFDKNSYDINSLNEDFKNISNDAFVFTEDMRKNADKFTKSSNFIVSFGDIPQIQIRSIQRNNKELFVICCESEDFCVEDYVRTIKHSNKNGKFDITITYLGNDLKPYRIDSFKSCKIKQITPSILNQVQSSESLNKVNMLIKFKKHDIATNEGQNNKKNNK